MSVTLRAAGTWENGATGLTADEVVAVPAAQVTGDMMLLIGCWKDYAITAQVSGWTELFELADGTTSTGNGSGSMKVGVWYKVAASDTESDPTLDFSTTTGLLGEAVIVVFQKAAGDSWNTPTYVVGAWPNGGSSPQTISASSTITVPSGSAVVSVLAIRDDSSTFTRGNTALDDSAGAVTWNGNYVESPATHASTTTGNDMSCDAGYRLVTTGATGVTLRQTATLSANETGQGAWVVLSVATAQTLTPDPVAAVTAVPAPTVASTYSVAPDPVAAVTAVTAPTVGLVKALTPDPVAVVTAVPAPTVIVDQVVAPDPVAVTLAVPAPTVGLVTAITPDPVAVVTAVPAPTVETVIALTPDPVAVVTAVPAPTVGLETTVAPDPVAAVTAVIAPTVETLVTLAPDPVAAVTAVPAPTVETEAGTTTLTPDPVAATLAVPAPTVATVVSLAPSPVPAVTAVPAPTLTVDQLLSPAPVAVVAAVPAPVIVVDQVVSPAPVAVVLRVPAPVIGGITPPVRPGRRKTTPIAEYFDIDADDEDVILAHVA